MAIAERAERPIEKKAKKDIGGVYLSFPSTSLSYCKSKDKMNYIENALTLRAICNGIMIYEYFETEDKYGASSTCRVRLQG